ncbi:MAG: hypothetical protein ACK5ZX_00195 [Bacteroidota bacterium]|jgi:hypothetical protein
MKKVITIIVMLCAFNSAFAQKDLIDRIEQQAIEIDSLRKLVKSEIDSRQIARNENSKLRDTLNKLRFELANLEEIRKSKKNIDSMIRQKSDSIALLKAGITDKDKLLAKEKQKAEQKVKEEYEKGKNEILTIIINKYKIQSFDELLKSSSKQSIVQDLLLCQSVPEINQILSDIQKYFNAKELLDVQLDAAQLKNQQLQLGQIKRESVVLGKLKEIISNYQSFNDGFKETVERIISLDKREVVSGMSNDIQKKKFDKILAELSSYIFNYDFNFSDYPYLADILLEIIKRKQPNADADIADLLKKL